MGAIRRAILVLAAAAAISAAADLKLERIFGPEVRTGPYKHPACITELNNGDLYLVYYGGGGEYETDTAVYGSRLVKGGTAWSAPRPIARDPFRSAGNGVVWQAPDGTVWLFYVVRFGATWSDSRIQVKVSHDNAANLVAYCRRGGGYGPGTEGFLVRAESRDGGRTWTEGRDSAFPNPNSAVDFLKLRSGNLLLVFNDSPVDRTPLAAALSTDHDRSYPHRRNIAAGPGDFAYSVAIQDREGLIHVVYTSHSRTVINRAVFSEAWVLSGR